MWLIQQGNFWIRLIGREDNSKKTPSGIRKWITTRCFKISIKKSRA